MTRARWPLYTVLAICALAVFWTQGPGYPWRDSFFLTCGLSHQALAEGRWWTFLTHGFLHGAWWHAGFNLAGLWVLGRHITEQHGARVFLTVMGAGILAGGLAQMLFAPIGILVGISGGVMALVTAAGFLWNDRMVGFRLGSWRFGQVKGYFLAWGMLGASLLTAVIAPIFPAALGTIGHACHAGAAVAGAIVVGIARGTALRAEK